MEPLEEKISIELTRSEWLSIMILLGGVKRSDVPLKIRSEIAGSLYTQYVNAKPKDL